jgi:hypothetical protein
MQFLRIFTYVQVATALITFIQQAQEAVRDRSGAGAEKKAMVLPQLTALVQSLQAVGLIDQRVASAITNGAGLIIDAFVLVLKGAGLLGGNEETAGDASAADVSTPTAPASIV